MPKQLNNILVKPAASDCNMACTYCFYNSGKNLYPELKKHRMKYLVLEEMIRQMMQQDERELAFIWQGGEPTVLGIDFFRKAVEFQMKYGRGHRVGNAIQTNGILIDRKWACFLSDYRFLVGLSIDGPEKIHDRYRLMPGGKSSWEKTLNASKVLQDKGVAVNALSVITDFSSNYPDEIYGFLKEIGLTHMQFIPCVERDMHNPDKSAPFSVSSDNYGKFLCRIFDLWFSDFKDGKPVTSVRFFESLLFSYAGLTPPDCGLMKECGVYLVVEHNGDVFSCDFFVEPEFRLGNLMEISLYEMLNSNAQTDFGRMKNSLPVKCKDCAHLIHCRGGCIKDRIRDPSDMGISHFCNAYKSFFKHADAKLKELVSAKGF
jgi:uncharacterized protein